MGSRASLNKVLLIGNLTRDPELRYTPSGAAVCTFGIATNRYYVASDGTKKEDTEFIKIVSWNKLAELCSQLLAKGRKVYVEGRLQTRSWETPDGQNRQTTEVVIDDMRILDSKKDFDAASDEESVYHPEVGVVPVAEVKGEQGEAGETTSKQTDSAKSAKAKKGTTKESPKQVGEEKKEQEVDLDDLPF